jgi:hypothetical protein
MSIYSMVYFDRRGQVAAVEEFDASDDGAALKRASGSDWSGSYEVRHGARTLYAHVGPRHIAGR